MIHILTVGLCSINATATSTMDGLNSVNVLDLEPSTQE